MVIPPGKPWNSSVLSSMLSIIGMVIVLGFFMIGKIKGSTQPGKGDKSPKDVEEKENTLILEPGEASQWESKNTKTSPLAKLAPASLAPISPDCLGKIFRKTFSP